jgi:hypothetical protein
MDQKAIHGGGGLFSSRSCCCNAGPRACKQFRTPPPRAPRCRALRSFAPPPLLRPLPLKRAVHVCSPHPPLSISRSATKRRGCRKERVGGGTWRSGSPHSSHAGAYQPAHRLLQVFGPSWRGAAGYMRSRLKLLRDWVGGVSGHHLALHLLLYLLQSISLVVLFHLASGRAPGLSQPISR